MVGSPIVVGSWGDRHRRGAVEKGPTSISRLSYQDGLPGEEAVVVTRIGRAGRGGQMWDRA